MRSTEAMVCCVMEREYLRKAGTTGVDIFNWWMEYDILPGQIDLFEEMEDYDE